MFWRDIILYSALGVFVLYVTRVNNMWGVSRGTKKAKEEVRLQKARESARKRTLAFTRYLEWVYSNIGFELGDSKKETVAFRIDRLGLKFKALERNVKPSELYGMLKTIQLVGLFYSLLVFGMTLSPLALIGIPFMLAPYIFTLYADSVITAEDDLLEENFPSLYTILYSRLVQGSKVRIAPTLTDFLATMDKTGSLDKGDEVLRKFVLDFRNNIDLYGDDSMAITRLREKYTSVMIVNFCNLAVQAVRGVDNKDKLLAFNMELSAKQKALMDARADKLVRRGEWAVKAVWLILFQFIAISWVAKLSQAGGISSILGF